MGGTKAGCVLFYDLFVALDSRMILPVKRMMHVCLRSFIEMWRQEKRKRNKEDEIVGEMTERKAKVTRGLIRHDKKQGGRKEVERMQGRNGARRRRSIWLKGYFLSRGSGCQSDLVAFVVPPFRCDLTLSQGETCDRSTDLSSISHLTLSHIFYLSLSFSLSVNFTISRATLY